MQASGITESASTLQNIENPNIILPADTTFSPTQRFKILKNIKKFWHERGNALITPFLLTDLQINEHEIIIKPTRLSTKLYKKIKPCLLLGLYGFTYCSVVDGITHAICALQGYIIGNTISVNVAYFIMLNLCVAAGCGILLGIAYQILKYTINNFSEPFIIQSMHDRQIDDQEDLKNQLLHAELHSYNQKILALYAYIVNETHTPLRLVGSNLEVLSTLLDHSEQRSELIRLTAMYVNKIETVINSIQKLHHLRITNASLNEEIFTTETLTNLVFKQIKAFAENKNLLITYSSNFSKNFQLIGDLNKLAKILINLLINIINRTKPHYSIEMVINKEIELLSYVQLYLYVTSNKPESSSGYNSGSSSDSNEGTKYIDRIQGKGKKRNATKQPVFNATLACNLINELNDKNIFQKLSNPMGLKCHKGKPLFWFRVSVQKPTLLISSPSECLATSQDASHRRNSSTLKPDQQCLQQYALARQTTSWGKQQAQSSSSSAETHVSLSDLATLESTKYRTSYTCP